MVVGCDIFYLDPINLFTVVIAPNVQDGPNTGQVLAAVD